MRLIRGALGFAIMACVVSAATPGEVRPAEGRRAEFRSGRIDCSLATDRVTNPYEVATFMVLPGERLDFRLDGPHIESHRLQVDAGTLVEEHGFAWSWRAPAEPGIYAGRLDHPDDGTTTRLNLIVLVPMTDAEEGSLNGYRIGTYPAPMSGREQFYRTPRGFITLTAQNAETLLSPHFKLGQFPSKQRPTYPKYVVLRERLLVALERILEEVNFRGFSAETLFVMSGYRTPSYNRTLGNVANSRHVFGDAADIFVDQDPADGIMDDLDGNGRIGPGDNRVLAVIVETALGRAGSGFTGGLGLYPANSVHGPFVHLDLRGYRARW